MVDVRWGGEQWRLLHHRAVYWPRQRTLLVADLHLGKPAAFGSAGIPVPHSCPHDLDRLSAAVACCTDAGGVERLVILGDLLHARSGCTREVMDALREWRPRHSRLDVLLVRGNHDDRAGDPPTELGFRIANEPASDPGDGHVRFAHYPPNDPHADADTLTMCGHLHPAVRLDGSVSAARWSCFWCTPSAMILPAFGSFTGDKVVRPVEGDRLFAVGPECVAEVPTVVRGRFGPRGQSRQLRC